MVSPQFPLNPFFKERIVTCINLQGTFQRVFSSTFLFFSVTLSLRIVLWCRAVLDVVLGDASEINGHTLQG